VFTKRDIKYFNFATDIAQDSEHYKCRLGAVIVQNGEIVSSAINIQKSHPMQKKYNVHRQMKGCNHHHHLHAEMHAILKTQNKDKLKGSTIYVSRIKDDGSIGMARPCPACLNAIIDFGIKNIFYTTNIGYAQEMIA